MQDPQIQKISRLRREDLFYGTSSRPKLIRGGYPPPPPPSSCAKKRTLFAPQNAFCQRSSFPTPYGRTSTRWGTLKGVTMSYCRMSKPVKFIYRVLMGSWRQPPPPKSQIPVAKRVFENRVNLIFFKNLKT